MCVCVCVCLSVCLCVCVCVYSCVYVCIHTRTHAHTHTHTHTLARVRTHKHTHTNTHTQEITNEHQVRGNIVYIKRGGCSFTKKARMAQKAGAVGMVVANSDRETFGMSCVPLPMLTLTKIIFIKLN